MKLTSSKKLLLHSILLASVVSTINVIPAWADNHHSLDDTEMGEIYGGMSAQTIIRPASGMVSNSDGIRVTADLQSQYNPHPSNVVVEVYAEDLLGGLTKSGWGVVSLNSSGAGRFDYSTTTWPLNTSGSNNYQHKLILKHCDPTGGGAGCQLEVDGSSSKNNIQIDHRLKVANIVFWNVDDEFHSNSTKPGNNLRYADDSAGVTTSWRYGISLDKIYGQCSGGDKEIVGVRWQSGGTLSLPDGCSKITNLERNYSGNYDTNDTPTYCADRYGKDADYTNPNIFSRIHDAVLARRYEIPGHDYLDDIHVVFLNNIWTFANAQNSPNYPNQIDSVLGMADGTQYIVLPDYFNDKKNVSIVAHEIGHLMGLPHPDTISNIPWHVLDNCSGTVSNRHLMCSTYIEYGSGNSNRYLKGQNYIDCDRIYYNSSWDYWFDNRN